MIIKRISEMMGGLEIDIDTLQLPNADFIDAEEIKAIVSQRIINLEDPDKSGATNT